MTVAARRIAAWLSCLLLAAPAAASAAPALTPSALLDSVVARYARLPKFDMTGEMRATIHGGGQLDGHVVLIPFRFAAVRPGRVRNELDNPNLNTLMIVSGDTLYTSVPALHQYTAQPAPTPVPGQSGSDLFARALDPFASFNVRAANGLFEGAEDQGSDTVHTAAGAVACRRILVTYAPDSAQATTRLHPRTMWIDEVRSLVLRDSLTVDLQNPQFGPLTTVQDTRFVQLELDSGGPDSLYHFHAPADFRRVERIGAPGMDPPDLAGKPAGDFTLAGLDARKVHLAALRGHVVVLDFWATWCGPCRRWLPTVAKAQKALAPKGVQVFAVNLREARPKVNQYLAANALHIPVLLDSDGAVAAAYGASSIPLTVIIGRDGKVVRTLLGLHEEGDLRAALAEAGVVW